MGYFSFEKMAMDDISRFLYKIIEKEKNLEKCICFNVNFDDSCSKIL